MLHCTADMEKLEVLDLEANRVDDLDALVYLGWCPQLAILTLADNPVAQEPTYNVQVLLHCLLSLAMLYYAAFACGLISIHNKRSMMEDA